MTAVKAAGGKAIALQGDMGKEADIERVFAETAKALGPITHFVHSSGIIGPMSRLDEADSKTMREVLDVNTLGALLCMRACVRGMSTKHGGKGGSIVMVSSMSATLGSANECVWYAASKGAVDAMVIGMSREVAKEGIRVNAVSPGMIDTDIQPPGRVERLMSALPQGPRRIGRRRSPRASCSCCRMRQLTSTARICASPARADATERPPCAGADVGCL